MKKSKDEKKKNKASEKDAKFASKAAKQPENSSKTPLQNAQNVQNAQNAQNVKKEDAKPNSDKDVKKKGKGEDNKPAKPKFFDGPSTRLVHQIMPFAMICLALLMLCIVLLAKILPNGIGAVGNFLHMVLFGFLGFGAFAIPVLLVNLGIFWRKMVDNGNIRSKHVLSALSMLFISTFAHIIAIYANTEHERFGFAITTLWSRGTSYAGGGILGGLLGELLYWAFSFAGSLIIVIALTSIFLMFSFGITPVNIWTYVKFRLKVRKDKKAALKYEAEHKNAEALTYRQRRESEGNGDENAVLGVQLIEEGSRKDRRKTANNPLVDDDEDLSDNIIVDEERAKNNSGIIRPSEGGDSRRFEDKNPMIKIPEGEAPKSQKKDDYFDLNSVFKYYPDGDENNTSAPTETFAEQRPMALQSRPSAPAQPAAEQKPVAIGNTSGGDTDLNPLAASPVKPTGTARNDSSKVIANMSLINDDETQNISDDENDAPKSNAPTVGVQLQAYVFPPVELLAESKSQRNDEDFKEELVENAERLMETLRSFNVKIKEITYSRGPTITRYELKPEAGTRVRSIANLVDDIALSLATSGVRIEAPIPNKPAVGIEVPNRTPETVYLRNLIDSDKFKEESGKLTACLGEDVGGKPIYFNIAKMPHLLIAGATGMGKSVCINSIIVSLLYKAKPEEVKLILIDPKKVEFNIYRDIPHLYTPIVSDPKKAAGALASAVAEMERRFALIEDVGVRDIKGYNEITAGDPDREFLPHIVIIIDELADLMMTAPDDVEASICRLAQKARAAGMHIIIGTQRPSVDVITGLIKANIPSRIACTVASQVDSRTIIDIAGAEKLIGRGDMLFAPVGAPKPIRVQGCFVSDGEVEAVVEYIKHNNAQVQYNNDFVNRIEEEAAKCGMGKKGAVASASADGDFGADGDGIDPKLREAIELAIDSGKISTSLLQRRIGVGYGRAAKIIDQMEEMGYVSAPDGNKPRKILITKQEYMEKVINDEIE